MEAELQPPQRGRGPSAACRAAEPWQPGALAQTLRPQLHLQARPLSASLLPARMALLLLLQVLVVVVVRLVTEACPPAQEGPTLQPPTCQPPRPLPPPPCPLLHLRLVLLLLLLPLLLLLLLATGQPSRQACLCQSCDRLHAGGGSQEENI